MNCTFVIPPASGTRVGRRTAGELDQPVFHQGLEVPRPRRPAIRVLVRDNDAHEHVRLEPLRELREHRTVAEDPAGYCHDTSCTGLRSGAERSRRELGRLLWLRFRLAVPASLADLTRRGDFDLAATIHDGVAEPAQIRHMHLLPLRQVAAQIKNKPFSGYGPSQCLSAGLYKWALRQLRCLTRLWRVPICARTAATRLPGC